MSVATIVDAGVGGITPDMFRAGVSVYFQWNAEQEEIELLVAGIFYAMLEAAPISSQYEVRNGLLTKE